MTDNPGSISEAIVVHDEELMDPDAAIKKAEELLAGDKSLEKVIARCRQGRKRHPGYGLQKLRPLPGASAKMGGKIRAIVGMRYSGYPDTLIEKAFGWTPSYIQKMEFRHYKAFAAAKEDLLKSAVTEYNQNVAKISTATRQNSYIEDAEAVDVEIDEMDD
jgi:hypothetical protein